MLKHKNILLFCMAILVVLGTFYFIYDVKWWAFLLLFLFWLAMTVWGSADIGLGYFVKTYCNNPNEKQRKIAISFDDGPHPMTAKVLDVLQKYEVKASFFCIGKQIEKYPDVFKRIIEEGHVVGNHSYSHSTGFGFSSTDKVVGEIELTNDLIERLSGKKVLLFRPPFGVTNPQISRAVKRTGQFVIGWNNRSLDTVIANENTIVARVKRKVVPGGIILLHDTSVKTVAALEQILLFLQAENYEVIPVNILLNLPAYEN